jgi:uncharacterized protein YoxC
LFKGSMRYNFVFMIFFITAFCILVASCSFLKSDVHIRNIPESKKLDTTLDQRQDQTKELDNNRHEINTQTNQILKQQKEEFSVWR